MLRQVCRQGRVEAAFEDDETFVELAKVLALPDPLGVATGESQSERLRTVKENAQDLTRDEYEALLFFLRRTGQVYHSVYDGVIADYGTRYLLPFVQHQKNIAIDGKTYSTRESHEPNSAIQFLEPISGIKATGNIEAIWLAPLSSRVRTFVVVRGHVSLVPTEEAKAPFLNFNPNYAARIVSASNSGQLFILEPCNIITHLSTYCRPAGTYGIPVDTVVVCWALNRGRR